MLQTSLERSSTLATRHPHRCLPISKLFQERASSPINFIFIDRFSSLRFRILIYTELELYASTIWLFCVHSASRDAGSCFRRRFIDRSDFFLAVTIPRETRRRKHSTSVETSKAKLAAAKKKERKAYKCHEEMSFADDQGDSQEEEEEAPM